MARCDTTERINASPSRVWNRFRPERMKQWYGPEIRVLSPGPLAKGSRISVTGQSGPKRFGYDATVTEYADNRTLVWEGADNKATYRVTFLLAPKEGATVVLLRDEFHLKGLIGRLIEKLFMVRRVAKYDRHFLGKLKTLVETP
jgi:uncharacterized protein YndB with AHSA1/START domain